MACSPQSRIGIGGAGRAFPFLGEPVNTALDALWRNPWP